MNKENYKKLVEQVASDIGSKEKLTNLMRLLLLPFSGETIEVGDTNIHDFYGHLKVDGVTYDHLGMQFAATKSSRDRIISVLKEIGEVMDEKSTPKKEKGKKSYK